MRDDTASLTARAVAARRLKFERPAAPFGDSAADDALARDVAGREAVAEGWLDRYLRARTAFFDQVVLSAVDRGVRQVVVGAAGYDGRSLRYAKPGVRWFEVDHPVTQADKRERLTRLGIDAGHVAFVSADFTGDPVADRLRDAGLDAGQAALFLLEGVAIYLDNAVTERVLAQFRRVTPSGSVLAISVSTSADGEKRERLRERVAELGEPARSVLPAEQARVLLARAGWEITEPEGPRGPRARAAGLLAARAVPD
jgi:methyltransferase (TIGR00027 family)